MAGLDICQSRVQLKLMNFCFFLFFIFLQAKKASRKNQLDMPPCTRWKGGENHHSHAQKKWKIQDAHAKNKHEEQNKKTWTKKCEQRISNEWTIHINPFKWANSFNYKFSLSHILLVLKLLFILGQNLKACFQTLKKKEIIVPTLVIYQSYAQTKKQWSHFKNLSCLHKWGFSN